MWLISLLFLPLSSALFTIPYGIQYNGEIEDVLKSECTLCYEVYYEEGTSSIDILSCAGPVLFVGARRYEPWLKKNLIQLGAFGLASAVHRTTALNTPHFSNGVYWYFTPGKSFGFLKDTDLHQEPAGDTGTTNIEARLSWNLNGHGGHQPGISGDEPSMYLKIIYNCPNTF